MKKKLQTALLDLTSDGCTFSPDGWWTECCAEHDFYYRNAVGISRLRADLTLSWCMIRRGAILHGLFFFIGVRIWGGKNFKGAGMNHISWLDKEEEL